MKAKGALSALVVVAWFILLPVLTPLMLLQSSPPANASGSTAHFGGMFRPPIDSPLSVTSPFGMRIHPIFGVAIGHAGVDLASPYGEKQFATAAGKVIYADWYGGCGNAVRIDHGQMGGAGYVTMHCHLSSILASVGQQVNPGDVVGLTGSTGNSTGPHVHYQIEKDGTPIDPWPILTAPANDGNAVVDFALSKVGGPYVWGGNGPSGFDCSGLTKAAYASIGVEIPRTADAQYHAGVHLTWDQVRPGDLFYEEAPFKHVGIFISSTEVVEAANEDVGIVKRSVRDSMMPFRPKK